MRSGGALIIAPWNPAGSPSDKSQGICTYQQGAIRRKSGISGAPSGALSRRSSASSTGM